MNIYIYTIYIYTCSTEALGRPTWESSPSTRHRRVYAYTLYIHV